MIFDQSSKNYDTLSEYMGRVTFSQFRNTGYYSVNIVKDAEKERFFKEQILPVKTTSEVLSNWQSTGMTKFINGVWYVKNHVLFNVQHELIHQNYKFTQKTLLN